jgi:hypothetical protein
MKNQTRKKTNQSAVPLAAPDRGVEIARRAYDIWRNEGGNHGYDVDHWLRAEREHAGTEKAAGLERGKE